MRKLIQFFTTTEKKKSDYKRNCDYYSAICYELCGKIYVSAVVASFISFVVFICSVSIADTAGSLFINDNQNGSYLLQSTIDVFIVGFLVYKLVRPRFVQEERSKFKDLLFRLLFFTHFKNEKPLWLFEELDECRRKEGLYKYLYKETFFSLIRLSIFLPIILYYMDTITKHQGFLY